jgi:hypothetical protein
MQRRIACVNRIYDSDCTEKQTAKEIKRNKEWTNHRLSLDKAQRIKSKTQKH